MRLVTAAREVTARRVKDDADGCITGEHSGCVPRLKNACISGEFGGTLQNLHKQIPRNRGGVLFFGIAPPFPLFQGFS